MGHGQVVVWGFKRLTLLLSRRAGLVPGCWKGRGENAFLADFRSDALFRKLSAARPILKEP
ncbi:MAG: hypothetical protein CM15mP8_0350 [Methanobacteriota archaeon]|nr:MAG: hypothetical protein CM15mP8_0350 [Euryarchaeota archaeon]